MNWYPNLLPEQHPVQRLVDRVESPKPKQLNRSQIVMGSQKHRDSRFLPCFSERNIKLMLALYREYPNPGEFVPPPVAQMMLQRKSPQPVAKLTGSEKVQPPVAQLPTAMLWAIPQAHHLTIMQKVTDLPTTYQLARALPRELQSALPTVEAIEAELGKTLKRPEPPHSSALKHRKTTGNHSKKK